MQKVAKQEAATVLLQGLDYLQLPLGEETGAASQIPGLGGQGDFPELSGQARPCTPSLPQPSRRKGTFERAKDTGVAVAGHLRQQLLPVGIHGRPLQHSLDRMDRFLGQLRSRFLLTPHHEAGMTPSLQPHLNQIPHAKLQQFRVGVGEHLPFPSCFEPDIQPDGRLS